MPCTPIDLGGGAVAIVCTRGRRKTCSSCQRAIASKLCDYPLRGEKAGKTCDADLCDRCATNVGPDRDYCPPHARIAAGDRLIAMLDAAQTPEQLADASRVGKATWSTLTEPAKEAVEAALRQAKARVEKAKATGG